MITRQTANLVSTPHLAGTLELPASPNRSYFLVVAGTSAVTVKFGGGAGEIPVPANSHFEPRVCPTGKIVITCAGTFTVLMG